MKTNFQAVNYVRRNSKERLAFELGLQWGAIIMAIPCLLLIVALRQYV